MKVEIVADSISDEGKRITSFQLRYWRPIHSEVMTHRRFGRNARSSRAVPVVTLLSEQIFIPDFGMNQRGMQAKDEAVDPELLESWRNEWSALAAITRDYVRRWGEQGMHKQWANRPLEWFGWIDVLITATEWNNFWWLRDHWMAQPELRQLAHEMRRQFNDHIPELLKPGEWHLPYILASERVEFNYETLLRLSTARCARLSYRPFDGDADHEAEFKRYHNLVISQPVHASPAEHQATPDTRERDIANSQDVWQHPELHGNLVGWMQHRKLLDNECVEG